MLVTDVAADVAAAVIKSAVGEERPAFRYPHPRALVHVPHDGSFPSGHAATSFACATVLARAAPRLAVPLYVLAAAIAYSRVYVGVHYPFDVVAGAALGIATTLLTLAASRRRSRRGPRAG